MIFKLLAIVAVLFLVYILFFKKSREEIVNKRKKYDEITDDMIECAKCGTFVSQNEAILSNGKYYCSKECLKG
jgi:uncharacterized protein